MRRISLMILISVLISTNALFAQNKPFRFGLKVSPNVGWLSTNSNGYEKDGSIPGYNWGLISDFTLADNYYFATGFTINRLNGRLNYEDLRSAPGTTDNDTVDLNRKYTLGYVDIPLMLKMSTNQFDKLKYFGQIGFSLGFNIKADAEDTFTLDSSEFESEDDISSEINLMRGALMLGGGVEYYLDNTTCLVLGVTYSNGITDILKSTNAVTGVKPKATLNYVEFTIGIIF